MKRILPITIIIVTLIITIYPSLTVQANPAIKIVGKVITREMRDTGKSIITKAGVRTSNKTALERANEAWFARLAKEEAEAIRRAAEKATPSGTPGWLKVTIGATLWFTGVDILIDLFSSDDPVEYYTNEVKPGETVIPGGYGISYKKVESPYSPDRWTLQFSTTNGDTYYLNTDRPISDNTHRIIDFTNDQELIGVSWNYANDYVMAHINVSNMEFNPSKYGFTAEQWDTFINYSSDWYKRILVLRMDDEIRYIPIITNANSKSAFHLFLPNFDKGKDGRYISAYIGTGLTVRYYYISEDGTLYGPTTSGMSIKKPEGFINFGLDNISLDDLMNHTYLTAYFGSHQYDTNSLIRVISDLPNATFAPQPAPALLPNTDPELWPDEEYVVEVLIPDPNFYPDTSSAINLNQEFLQGLNPTPNLSPQPAPAETPATSSPIQIDDPGTPGLKAVTQKFPFSLPWDIYHLISLIAAEPRAPVFVLDTDFDGIPIYFEHDMSYLDPYIGYFRTFVFIAAAVSIVYATRSLLGGAR